MSGDGGVTLEQLARRVAALEARLDQEAGLRASQDRDLSALADGQRAANHLLQALSITQSDHTRKFEDHTRILEGHTRKLDELTAGQSLIVSMLQTLIDTTGGDTPA